MLVPLGVGPGERSFKAFPVWRGSHQCQNADQVFFELGVPNVVSEPLEMFVPAATGCDRRIVPFEFSQHAWSEPVIHNVVRVLSDDGWTFYAVRSPDQMLPQFRG